MRFLNSVAFASIGLASGGFAAAVRLRTDIQSVFNDSSIDWSSGTTLSFPGDASFENVTERWAVFRPPTYAAAVSPETEADVVEAVKLATAYKIPLLATGGRHGYGTTLGNLHSGLAIDLSRLDGVSVDKSSDLLTVGGGVRFRDIVDIVYNAGYQIQTGTCSCPGMVGVTIGGGIGRLGGVYGLIIDALVSVRLVTADGKVLDVSERSNPDLFWGIRGAGANFGIITSATFRLHRRIESFTTVDVMFPAEKNVSYFNAVESLINRKNSPSSLTAKLAATSGILYNSTTNQPQISASWVYAGPRQEALRAMAPVLALKPSVLTINNIPWNRVTTEAGFGGDAETCIPDRVVSIYSANLRRFSASAAIQAFGKMGSFYAQYPDARGSSVLLESFPNEAAVAVPDDATAYPWRDTATYLLIQILLDEAGSSSDEPGNALGRELRQDFAAVSGYSGLSVYVNYAHGDETLEQIYGANKLPRLAKLKAQYDPKNVFAFNNPLPTRYP
ncbi:hypothetical protein GGS23DRAFT_612659 [Durotheca rogersii]|uniref:uncharacterized protein n=1 Tax=Durotheca rogersii TaxID=419775 RepID=UPI00221EACB0|nr:uncharacterized protein GGS23DRAFT_612659 [Durotheca rogersii]KAI5867521.1 hypothetical protein GGS23DRAFT_612659 [Durotheca rogersii]